MLVGTLKQLTYMPQFWLGKQRPLSSCGCLGATKSKVKNEKVPLKKRKKEKTLKNFINIQRDFFSQITVSYNRGRCTLLFLLIWPPVWKRQNFRGLPFSSQWYDNTSNLRIHAISFLFKKYFSCKWFGKLCRLKWVFEMCNFNNNFFWKRFFPAFQLVSGAVCGGRTSRAANWHF